MFTLWRSPQLTELMHPSPHIVGVIACSHQVLHYSSVFVHLITERLYPLLPFPQPQFPSNHHSTLFLWNWIFFQTLPISDRRQCLCMNISHTKVSSSFTHVVAKGKISTFLTWVIFPCVISHSFLIGLSISRPLGCFHVSAVVTIQQWT